MPTPEEIVADILAHADPTYDPRKAHEYYLRTRQLVGRKPGETTSPTSTRPSVSKGIPTSGATPATKPTQTKQDTIQAQMDALQARFDKLKKILADLVAAAKGRSGVDTSTPDAKPTKPETAAEKQKRSDAAQKYYDQHKNDAPSTPAEQLKALQQKIKDIQAKIKKLQEEAAAKKKPVPPKTTPKPKPKPAPKPAPKPTHKPKPVVTKKPVVKPRPKSGSVGAIKYE